MTTNKPVDSYDEIKGMLNKVRKIQSLTKNKYGMIQEEIGDERSIPPSEQQPPTNNTMSNADPKRYGIFHDKGEQNGSGEDNDFAVINNVEVQIHSEDPEALNLSDDEKGKVSQLIDDFRTEVSEIAEFEKLDVYNDSAKLTGKITDMNLGFTLSTGDDTGLYLSNASLLKIDDRSFDMINKLRTFETKFSNSINDLLVNRSAI